jgi:serine/threonine protein kinase
MEHVHHQQRTYTILGVIGEGGFGRVYRARMRDGGFEKDVAVKMLHDRNPSPELLARFRDEARILALVRDRAVVSVDPPIQLDDRWAVVMDFVDGLSIGQIVRKIGKMPPPVALEITAEIARALDKAYRFPGPGGAPLRLLHRDIKPGNIQVTPSGEIRLLDFGTAWADFGNREASTKSDISGTPGYIAPERLEGQDGPAADIFSLGVTLWFMLTGENPGKRRGADLTNALVELAADDGELAAALSLAIRMRDRYEQGRPTAKQVQNEARELIRGMDGPYLDEWSSNIPHRALEDDRLVGQQLTETLRTVATTEPHGASVSRTLVYGTGVGMIGIIASTLLGALVGLLIFLVVVGLGANEGRVEPNPGNRPGADGVAEEPAPPVPSEPVRPAKPVPPGATAIDFVSEPSGATVTVDGRALGKTPLLKEPLADGEHRVVLKKGLFEVAGVLDVGSDHPVRYTWDVTQGSEGLRPPLAAVGSVPIAFESTPSGATVLLDGAEIGVTPIAGHRIAHGEHTVTLKKGVLEVERAITVEDDGPTRWTWNATLGDAGLTPSN